MKTLSTKTAINLLLAGKDPRAKRYAGYHVLVIKNKIIPLKEGERAIHDLEKLEKKYGETPTLVFVPRPDVSYILVTCRQ